MYEFEEQPDYHNFHPDTGRKFSRIPLVESLQRTGADFAMSALMFTLPVETDSPTKRTARRVAGTLLDFVSGASDVKKFRASAPTDSDHSGMNLLSRREWVAVSTLSTVAAVALIVAVPEAVKDISEVIDTTTVHHQEPEPSPYSIPSATDPAGTHWLIQPGLEGQRQLGK